MRGNMRPKIKVRGYMVNFQPFFAHIPPAVFTTNPHMAPQFSRTRTHFVVKP